MNVLLFILALVHTIISGLMMFRTDYTGLGLRKKAYDLNKSIKSIPLLQLFYADWLISFIVCLVIVLLASMKPK